MKNLTIGPAWNDTPRTNALVQEIQSTPIPFEVAFWQLLHMTRTLEAENNKLRQSKKRNVSRQANNKVVARKMLGRPRAKAARKS